MPIEDDLEAVGYSAPSFTAVKFWAAEFKRDHTSKGEDECLEGPKSAITDDDIAKQMVLIDRRIKMTEIKEAMGMCLFES